MSVNFRRKEAREALIKATQDGIGFAAVFLQAEMKKELSRRGTGRIYIKPSGRRHQASAPGEPPAVDSGHYRRSIQVDLSQQREPIAIARVGTNVIYGRQLEFGDSTRNLAPRPHWIPIIRAKSNLVREQVFKVIQKRIPGIKFV